MNHRYVCAVVLLIRNIILVVRVDLLHSVLFNVVSWSSLFPSQDIAGDTALHEASSKGKVKLAKMLLAKQSTDTKIRNEKGFNVLHLAVTQKDEE